MRRRDPCLLLDDNNEDKERMEIENPKLIWEFIQASEGL